LQSLTVHDPETPWQLHDTSASAIDWSITCEIKKNSDEI